jgi:hypothetical protein
LQRTWLASLQVNPDETQEKIFDPKALCDDKSLCDNSVINEVK